MEQSKVKVGMKVRILKESEMSTPPRFGWNARMSEYSDRIVTITKVLLSGEIYFNECSKWGWTWHADMVGPVEKVVDGVIFEVAKSSDRFTVKQVEDGKVIVEDGIVYKKTDRKPVVEMTVAEIEAKLGVKNLKIVK